MSNKLKGLPPGGNTQKSAEPAQQRPAQGMITPPETVAGLVLKKTISDDETFGRCSHALQLLPNATILLLVTTEGEGGAPEVSTYLMGEEVHGFKVLKSMIETSDVTS